MPIKVLALDLDSTLAIDNHAAMTNTHEELIKPHNEDVETLHKHAIFICGNHDEGGIPDVINYIKRYKKTIST